MPRGSNRAKGAPGLPGSGRPPQSLTLRIGDVFAFKEVMDGCSTAFEAGEIVRIERGIPRTAVIQMRDGSTMYVLIETPKE